MSAVTKILICTIFGCGAVASSPIPLVLPPGSSVNPVDYGAVPNDGISDRDAFQAAIDSIANGGELTIGTGHWTMTKAPLNAYNRFATLATHGKDITIRGLSKEESTLELVGDQGGTGIIVLAIDASATNIVLDGFHIDTDRAFNTDEQTHAIATTGTCSASLGTCKPIVGLIVKNMKINHKKIGLERKGDGLRLLGNAVETVVKNVLVQNNDFDDCARSGIELQRGLQHVKILDNRINCVTCDQSIDGEASGVTPGLEDYDIEITRNKVISGPNTQGDYDIALTSVIGAHVHHNQLSRGIATYRSTFVEIDHESIMLQARAGSGVIEVSNLCDKLNVHDVVLVRSGVPGPIVRLTPHSQALCKDAKIENNVMVQGTPGFGVYMESVSGAEIKNNIMAWTVPAPGISAIYSRGTIAVIERLRLTDNTIASSTLAGFSLFDASPNAIKDAVVTGNRARGPIAGMICHGVGGFGGGVQAADNLLSASSCPLVAVATQAESP